jgi:hypothetical protein
MFSTLTLILNPHGMAIHYVHLILILLLHNQDHFALLLKVKSTSPPPLYFAVITLNISILPFRTEGMFGKIPDGINNFLLCWL